MSAPQDSSQDVSAKPDFTRPGRTLDYPCDQRPEPGQTVELAPGIHWIRMRLPMQLNHINLWLLEEDDGWTIVDTGLKDQPTKDAWEQLFQNVMRGKPVKRVIVTHLHPDHIGLAGWLVRLFDVDLWMTRTDYLLCRILVADTGQEAPAEGIKFYRAAGYPEEMIEAYKTRFGMFGHGVYRLPNAYRRIVDGEKITIGGRIWTVIVGTGHAPEHACLYCESLNIFISGDQLLPRISSNVSVHPTQPEANPLQDWLDSCHKLKTHLAEDCLVLPSHNEPFRGAHKRLDELIQEHESSMAKLLELCHIPMRAVDCFPALFRSRITSGNYGMATGESIAHLNCLRARGHILRETDAQGVHWYRTK